MSNETKQDFAPDPVVCGECGAAVNPILVQDYDRDWWECPACGEPLSASTTHRGLRSKRMKRGRVL